jgi:hypothetical protein
MKADGIIFGYRPDNTGLQDSLIIPRRGLYLLLGLRLEEEDRQDGGYHSHDSIFQISFHVSVF